MRVGSGQAQCSPHVVGAGAPPAGKSALLSTLRCPLARALAADIVCPAVVWGTEREELSRVSSQQKELHVEEVTPPVSLYLHSRLQCCPHLPTRVGCLGCGVAADRPARARVAAVGAAVVRAHAADQGAQRSRHHAATLCRYSSHRLPSTDTASSPSSRCCAAAVEMEARCQHELSQRAECERSLETAQQRLQELQASSQAAYQRLTAQVDLLTRRTEQSAPAKKEGGSGPQAVPAFEAEASAPIDGPNGSAGGEAINPGANSDAPIATAKSGAASGSGC